MQIEEIDANAFAAIIITDIFHVKPLFNGLSRLVVETIYNHIDDIIAEKK